MDARTKQFVAELNAAFKVEALEHLQKISDGLLSLEQNSASESNKEIIETIFRDAHSLKGAARAVNKIEMQEICQLLEDVLSEQRKGSLQLNAQDFDHLHTTVDTLTKLLDHSEKREGGYESDLKDLISCLEQISCRKDGVVAKETFLFNRETTPYGNSPTDPTVRVGVRKLDKLMQQVEELSILKLITTQRYLAFGDLITKLNRWKTGWGQVQADLRRMRQAYEGNKEHYIPPKELIEFLEEQSNLIADFEEKLLKQSKHTSQDMRMATSMIDVLLEDTKTILMLPFSSVFDLFPKMVREISRMLNKNVTTLINGGDVEVDRKILEEMKDPLIHLIRNCIDHGIESPEERQKKGKILQGELFFQQCSRGAIALRSPYVMMEKE